MGTLHKGWALISGAALTTLVAGTAIAPFAVHHFHRMIHYGLANLIAAPLVSLLIMPMVVLSLIAMPIGLEAWPLRAMGLGIELMVGAGQWAASWPGAVTVLPRISGQALGLVIVAFDIALAPASERPDVLIEREGATAALRSESGNLVFPPATAASYKRRQRAACRRRRPRRCRGVLRRGRLSPR